MALHLDSHLFTRCLRRGEADDLHAQLRDIDDESWRDLVDRAAWHGVAPLLYHRLQRIENLTIPREHFVRLRDFYLHCLLRNSAILEQISEVVRETEKAGHSVLFLKGAYLANCVYEEAALRPMGDIDLLAPAQDAEGVQRLWARSTQTRVGDLDLPHPAGDDLLLHVCTHAAYNDEFRLGLAAACDVDEVVHRLGHELDWDRLVQTANSDGRARFVYAALRLAQRLLETPISEQVFASLDHDQADDEVVEDVVVYVLNTADTLPTTLTYMGEAATVGAKLRRLGRGLFPPPETLRRIYGLQLGTRLHFFYYLVRPFDLFFRRGREVLGFLTGSPRSKPALEKERRRRVITVWVREKAPKA